MKKYEQLAELLRDQIDKKIFRSRGKTPLDQALEQAAPCQYLNGSRGVSPVAGRRGCRGAGQVGLLCLSAEVGCPGASVDVAIHHKAQGGQ